MVKGEPTSTGRSLVRNNGAQTAVMSPKSPTNSERPTGSSTKPPVSSSSSKSAPDPPRPRADSGLVLTLDSLDLGEAPSSPAAVSPETREKDIAQPLQKKLLLNFDRQDSSARRRSGGSLSSSLRGPAMRNPFRIEPPTPPSSSTAVAPVQVQLPVAKPLFYPDDNETPAPKPSDGMESLTQGIQLMSSPSASPNKAKGKEAEIVPVPPLSSPLGKSGSSIRRKASPRVQVARKTTQRHPPQVRTLDTQQHTSNVVETVREYLAGLAFFV